MAQKYFQSLNYSLGNEDTTMEVDFIKELRPKKIFSVCGCGSRALPLLEAGAGTLGIVDISENQIKLCQLRYRTYLEFDYREFLIFWGFPPYADYDYGVERKLLFEKLKLSKDLQDFFLPMFENIQWNSLLYEGKWEKTFILMSKAVRAILGKDYGKIFSFRRLDEQVRYYENEFPLKRWRAVLFALGNKSVFNALLYKGDFIKKNVPESHFDYYSRAFDHLFRHTLVRESFFLNLCFFGKLVHEDANTIEAKEHNFNAIKKHLMENSPEVHFYLGDLFEKMGSLGEGTWDYVSLSDVPSYFSGDIEKNFMQKMSPFLSKNAVVCLRSYLRVPEVDTSGFEEITPRFSVPIDQEKVQMYRVQLFQKK